MTGEKKLLNKKRGGGRGRGSFFFSSFRFRFLGVLIREGSWRCWIREIA